MWNVESGISELPQSGKTIGPTKDKSKLDLAQDREKSRTDPLALV